MEKIKITGRTMDTPVENQPDIIALDPVSVPDDTFLAIPDTDGRYKISPLGVVVDTGSYDSLPNKTGRLPVIVNQKRDRRGDAYVSLQVPVYSRRGPLIEPRFVHRKSHIHNLLAKTFYPDRPFGKEYGTRVVLKNRAFPVSLDNIAFQKYDNTLYLLSKERSVALVGSMSGSENPSPDSIQASTFKKKKKGPTKFMEIPGSNGRYYIDKIGNLYSHDSAKFRFSECPKTGKLMVWLTFPGRGNSFFAYYTSIVAITKIINGSYTEGFVQSEHSLLSPAKKLLKDAHFAYQKNRDMWDFSVANIQARGNPSRDELIELSAGAATINPEEDPGKNIKKTEYKYFTKPKSVRFSKTEGLVVAAGRYSKPLLSYLQVKAAVIAYHNYDGTTIAMIAGGLLGPFESEEEKIKSEELTTWLLTECMPNQRYKSEKKWQKALKCLLLNIAKFDTGIESSDATPDGSL